tara:strand:- start:733 stop:2547 length:1815 start_codon:yes stop_codon:yes gene_type:complete
MKTLLEIFKDSSINSFTDYISLGKKIEQEKIANQLDINKTVNVAILSSSTLNGMKEVLIAQSSSFDIFVNVYIGEYGQYAQEILNSDSNLFSFNPDIVIINIDTKAIAGEYYYTPYTKKEKARKAWVKKTANFLLDLTSQICAKSSAKILLHNLEVPTYSPLGIVENKEMYGYIESIEDVNRVLREKCKSNNQVYIYDYNAFCSQLGKANVLDSKMYYMADLKLKTQFIPTLCRDYTKYIQAIASLTRKCIVLDLDNTLWGGTVGESGFEGIHLGPTPEGRPFLDFQKYLYALYDRGVILAINSKNNEEEAMEVIQNHPHMILRKKCFSAIRINWDDKVKNIKSLAEEINIGLDSLVFIDDDPMNREMVQKFLPEVAVIDLPKDSSMYVDTLINMSYFDSLRITTEDKLKGKMYQAEKERSNLSKTTLNLTDYLRSLNIIIYIKEANKNTIPRISQLTQKTNQFNLTTKRYTEEDIIKFSKSNDFRVISIRLIDKFGDSGLTGVAVIDKKNTNKWRIDTFLLSCRILGRRAEEVLLAYIIKEAKMKGVRYVYGHYIDSLKNAPAKNFYGDNGFKKIDSSDEMEVWKYDTKKEYSYPDFINYKIS